MDIFEVNNCEPLNIPAFQKAGLALTVRALSTDEIKLIQGTTTVEGDERLTAIARAVVICLGNADGTRHFKDDMIETVKTKMPLVTQGAIIKQCLKYNLLDSDSMDVEKKT